MIRIQCGERQNGILLKLATNSRKLGNVADLPCNLPREVAVSGGEYSQFWRVSTFYVLSFKHGLLILADWNFECSTTSFGIGKIVFAEVGFAVKTSHNDNGINNGINHRLTNFCKLRHENVPRMQPFQKTCENHVKSQYKTGG